MFVLKPVCRWNVCYNFPFFNYLLLTADCCLAQGTAKSFTKGNIWIHTNLNHNCMMERSFILFSFLFLIFPPYDLFVFLLANQSDLSES